MADSYADEIKQKMDALPANVRDFIYSADMAAIIQTIGAKHQLHVDQIGDLETAAAAVMIGLSEAKDFVSDVADSLNIDQTKASAIVADVNTQVFVKIQDAMKKGASAPRPAAATPPASTPMPPPVRSTPQPPPPASKPVAPQPPKPPAPPVVSAPKPPMPAPAVQKPAEIHPAEMMLSQKTLTVAPVSPKPTVSVPPAAPKPAVPAAPQATPPAAPQKPEPPAPKPYVADPYREPPE